MEAPSLVRAFYDRIWNSGDLDHAKAVLTPDFAFRGSLGAELDGIPAFLDYVRSVRGALEGYRCDVLECVSDANRAFAQMRFGGSHVGPFRDYAPTGKAVHWLGSALFHFDDGRISRLWVLGDLVGLDAVLRANQQGVTMNREATMLRHVLATLAYRLQKAARDAPPDFGTFQIGHDVRTPKEIVRHMTSVLGFARSHFVGGEHRPLPLPDLTTEIRRFHEMLSDLAGHFADGTEARGITAAQLLQGPLADAMTHVGQLAMLRRLAGAPIAPEDFSEADIDAERLGTDQPMPRSPDRIWPEAPTDRKPRD